MENTGEEQGGVSLHCVCVYLDESTFTAKGFLID